MEWREITIEWQGPSETVMTTFEGGGLIDGFCEISGMGAKFLDGWVTAIDSDSFGGSTGANTANEPSPQSEAVWIDSPPSRDVIFDPPASKISFYYAAMVDVTISAYDSAGNLLISQSFPRNNFFHCEGDPTGDYCQWDPVEIGNGSDSISRLNIFGGWNIIGFDDFAITRGITCPEEEYFRDPQFREILRDLWEQSNPVRDSSEPLDDTKEHGGWIVEENGSYRFEVWTGEADQCGATATPGVTEGTVVAAIHTHPLAYGTSFPGGYCNHPVGENFGICPFPSRDDKDLAEGYGIPHFLLDWNGIKQANPDRSWINKPGCINNSRIPEEPMSASCEAKKNL